MQNDYLTITIPSTGRKKRLADCLMSIDYGCVQINIGAKEPNDIPFDIVDSMKNISVCFSNDFPVETQNSLAFCSPLHSHILTISDDIIFAPGSIEKAVGALQQYFSDGDGIIGFDIANLSAKSKCPFAYMLVGNKFFNERLKRTLFFREYQHFYADIELGAFAERLGKFRICPEAQVTHFHPASGAAPDATYLYHRQEKWVHDNKIYQERLKCLNYKKSGNRK